MAHQLPLLDDPEFIAALEKLDGEFVSQTRNDRFTDHHRPTIEEWAHETQLELPDLPEAPKPSRTSVGERIAAAVTMLGGTLAGAGAAALVFHEQVARLLGK